MLTPRERRFVECYAGPGTGAEAAKSAGYSSKSYGALKVAASKLLERSEIRAAIEERAGRAEAARANAEPEAMDGIGEDAQRLVSAYAESLSWRSAATACGMTQLEMRAYRRRPEVQLAAEALLSERRIDLVACRVERAEILTSIARAEIEGRAAELEFPKHADRMRAIQLLNAMDAPVAQSTKDAVESAKTQEQPTRVIRLVSNGRAPE